MPAGGCCWPGLAGGCWTHLCIHATNRSSLLRASELTSLQPRLRLYFQNINMRWEWKGEKISDNLFTTYLRKDSIILNMIVTEAATPCPPPVLRDTMWWGMWQLWHLWRSSTMQRDNVTGDNCRVSELGLGFYLLLKMGLIRARKLKYLEYDGDNRLVTSHREPATITTSQRVF